MPVTIWSHDESKSVAGMAHVDTSAQRSFFDLSLAEPFGFVKYDDGKAREFHTVGGETRSSERYGCRFQLNGCSRLYLLMRATEIMQPNAVPDADSTIMIIGRDLLRYGRFNYDGIKGEFTLSVELPFTVEPPH